MLGDGTTGGGATGSASTGAGGADSVNAKQEGEPAEQRDQARYRVGGERSIGYSRPGGPGIRNGKTGSRYRRQTPYAEQGPRNSTPCSREGSRPRHIELLKGHMEDTASSRL